VAIVRIKLRTVSFSSAIRFLPELRCRCPLCGTPRVNQRRRRDRIDATSHRPASILQHLLGGKLYHCRGCRLQFYDLRPHRD
jgi:hypothetical protein